MSSGIERLRQHVEDCEPCRQEPLPIDRIDALLGSSRPDIDLASLSAQAFTVAQRALHAVALRRFWRQVVAVIAVALLPLPAILAYDAILLQLLHTAVSSVFSGTMATYLVFTYASALLFLFAASYAAIPVLMARTMLPRLSTNG